VSETKRTGHTPGPWTTYHGRATPWWKVLAEGRDVADVEGGEITVYNDPNHPEAVEANARLIAAAPDLLAALEEALQEISGAPDAWCHYCQDTGEGEPQGYCKAQPTCQERLNVKGDRCNRIRAALSKAESR
jgi:hypothetical protein